jgi:nucleotide-binding universal stress UspA family protein
MIAGKLEAKVHALFVVDQRKTQIPFMYAEGNYDIAYERIYLPPDQEIRAFYEKLKEDLLKFGEKCCRECENGGKETGVEVDWSVMEGFPAQVIRETALATDMLVVGQHGENAGMKKETIGSTTEELVRNSPRPILVVPREYREPEKVLFPYDGSRAAENALQFYTGNLSKTIGELLFLCAECEAGEEPVYGKEIDYLRQHHARVTVVKEIDHPIQAIHRVAERDSPDLIMVGSHGRHKLMDYLLGSTTIHVIRKSLLPVLVVY